MSLDEDIEIFNVHNIRYFLQVTNYLLFVMIDRHNFNQLLLFARNVSTATISKI